MQTLARHQRFLVVSANLKEFMLDDVYGPEVVDAFVKRIFKAIDSIILNTRDKWSTFS